MSDYAAHTHWIWSPSWPAVCHERAVIMLFRRTVCLNAKPQSSMIRISADTRYKLYVNDILVETGPSRGDAQVWFYDTVNLAPYLVKGLNVIAVSVLRYPESPLAGNHGMFRTHVPGLYVSGMITDEGGRSYDISADEKWKCLQDPSVSFYAEEERFAPLCIHEHAAGNESLFGWKLTSYCDFSWENAKEYPRKQVPGAVSPGNLFERTIPYMRRSRRLFRSMMPSNEKESCQDGVSLAEQTEQTGTDGILADIGSGFTKDSWLRFLRGEEILTIPPHSHVSVTLDAEEEMTAYLHLALASGKGSSIMLLYAEAYVLDGFEGPEQIPIKGDRTDAKQGHLIGYTDTYRAGGYGSVTNPEVYEPYWFRTFRFVQLTIETGEDPLLLVGLKYEETGYPLEIISRVDTSDPTLQGIWDISARTLRRCMHETYMDCPYYEQLQYIMDARSQILYTYAVSADDRLARKCIDDLGRSQRYDGLLNCSYPNMNPNVIPGFSIYYILMLHDHMMYFGDAELVASSMGIVDRILQFFALHTAPEGYVESIGGINEQGRFWSYIDWASEWNETSGMPPAGLHGRPITMETLLYIYGLQHAAELAAFAGRPGEAERYTELAIRAGNAVKTYCRGENGMFMDGPGVDEYSQHAQVFAILTGLVSPEEGQKLLKETIEHPDTYAQCTVAMRFYLFRALEMTGLYAYTDQYYEAWRRMIRLHCTTSIESEAYARSECHAWGALILYELPSVTLGVRPAAPGYEAVSINPVPGYISYASGTVRTPKGDISVSWKLVDGTLQLSYELPEGIRYSKCQEKDKRNKIMILENGAAG